MAAERGLSYNYICLTQRSLVKFSDWLAEAYPGKSPDTVTIDEIGKYLKGERRRKRHSLIQPPDRSGTGMDSSSTEAGRCVPCASWFWRYCSRTVRSPS